MDHAFDRAYIPYIMKVLKHLNFGEKFIRILEDSHRDITTQLILNSLSEEIKLTFSFRQGDPISMILYLIYVEPLLIKLAEVLKGFQMANLKEIDNDYWDDVEIVIEEEVDLVLAMKSLQDKEQYQGFCSTDHTSQKSWELASGLDV